MDTEKNFMNFENLSRLIEEHKKETHPYKRYEFDSTSYTMLLIDINNLLKENRKLKQKYENSVADYETTKFEKEQLNSLVNSCQEEIRKLKKELKERPKEYVFIGNAQNKTRDFINQITKDNKKHESHQQEFIKYLEDKRKKLENSHIHTVSDLLGSYDLNELRLNTLGEILQKYKEIIGVSDDKVD